MEKIKTDCNDKLEKFRLNFSRCTNGDVAPLKYILYLTVFRTIRL